MFPVSANGEDEPKSLSYAIRLYNPIGASGEHIEESGVSAAIMGHPAAGVAWLVNMLAPLGDGLKKGDIVLGGSFTRPIDISSGDVIYADYGPLGSIGVSFE